MQLIQLTSPTGPTATLPSLIKTALLQLPRVCQPTCPHPLGLSQAPSAVPPKTTSNCTGWKDPFHHIFFPKLRLGNLVLSKKTGRKRKREEEERGRGRQVPFDIWWPLGCPGGWMSLALIWARSLPNTSLPGGALGWDIELLQASVTLYEVRRCPIGVGLTN